jgi:hypothetical protein
LGNNDSPVVAFPPQTLQFDGSAKFFVMEQHSFQILKRRRLHSRNTKNLKRRNVGPAKFANQAIAAVVFGRESAELYFIICEQVVT